ncbi:MAG: hypothetical protein FWE49_02515, partial [Synergistaceae bacterium]|nr:hypothetical protein [Synergistaceae bacterium]
WEEIKASWGDLQNIPMPSWEELRESWVSETANDSNSIASDKDISDTDIPLSKMPPLSESKNSWGSIVDSKPALSWEEIKQSWINMGN